MLSGALHKTALLIYLINIFSYVLRNYFCFHNRVYVATEGFPCERLSSCGNNIFVSIRIPNEHIGQGTLMLCDGLKIYRSFAVAAGCTVKLSQAHRGRKKLFNLIIVDGFHSSIKHHYDFYLGIATKCLNL